MCVFITPTFTQINNTTKRRPKAIRKQTRVLRLDTEEEDVSGLAQTNRRGPLRSGHCHVCRSAADLRTVLCDPSCGSSRVSHRAESSSSRRRSQATGEPRLSLPVRRRRSRGRERGERTGLTGPTVLPLCGGSRYKRGRLN